jgi:hypothetical protein
MDKWFGKQGNEYSTSALNEQLIFQKYEKDKMRKKFLAGDIPGEIAKRAKKYNDALTDAQVKETLCEMNSMGLLTGFRFETKADKEKGREIASEYLAQQEFVKTELFPAELKCDADHVKFLRQIAYHLDVAMVPGPKGSIFMLDYQKSVQLLQTIKANAETLKLTKYDRKLLESFITATTKLSEELKPLMEETKTQLQAAGYNVIPTPGAFYGFENGEPFNINFFNCLTGFSEKTERFYYIASGAQTDGELANVLMSSYVEFLQSTCNNIAVYFVGRHPNDPSNFSEASSILNRGESQLGPHCLSFELDVAPHTTTVT